MNQLFGNKIPGNSIFLTLARLGGLFAALFITMGVLTSHAQNQIPGTIRPGEPLPENEVMNERVRREVEKEEGCGQSCYLQAGEKITGEYSIQLLLSHCALNVEKVEAFQESCSSSPLQGFGGQKFASLFNYTTQNQVSRQDKKCLVETCLAELFKKFDQLPPTLRVTIEKLSANRVFLNTAISDLSNEDLEDCFRIADPQERDQCFATRKHCFHIQNPGERNLCLEQKVVMEDLDPQTPADATTRFTQLQNSLQEEIQNVQNIESNPDAYLGPNAPDGADPGIIAMMAGSDYSASLRGAETNSQTIVGNAPTNLANPTEIIERSEETGRVVLRDEARRVEIMNNYKKDLSEINLTLNKCIQNPCDDDCQKNFPNIVEGLQCGSQSNRSIASTGNSTQNNPNQPQKISMWDKIVSFTLDLFGSSPQPEQDRSPNSTNQNQRVGGFQAAPWQLRGVVRGNLDKEKVDMDEWRQELNDPNRRTD